MRILFCLHYPGYLRYFDQVIHQLVAEGHTVMLAFERSNKQTEGLVCIKDIQEQVVISRRHPKRKDAYSRYFSDLQIGLDYIRYLQPAYRSKHYLRNRSRNKIKDDHFLAPLRKISWLPGPMVRLMMKFMLCMQKNIPVADDVSKYIERKLKPEIVLVSPLINPGSSQAEIIRACKKLKIPTGLLVASWDNLSSKGYIQTQPDRILVWNDLQRQEAVKIHHVADHKIVVTGAQPFDKWFNRTPQLDFDAFTQHVGLPGVQEYVLFVGSTNSISRPDDEKSFVLDWIRAIRRSKNPRLAKAGIMIRPHPYSDVNWRPEELAGLGPTTVWPQHKPNPVDAQDREEYFSSIYHCQTVVGINTSAMVESAILHKPVLSLIDKRFKHSQKETMHFDYLRDGKGGFVHVDNNMNAHLKSLSTALEQPDKFTGAHPRFVKEFIRPLSSKTDCSVHVTKAIKDLAQVTVSKAPTPAPEWMHEWAPKANQWLLDNHPPYVEAQHLFSDVQSSDSRQNALPKDEADSHNSEEKHAPVSSSP